ncbi:centrosomal protein CCDC61-like [Ischnura elegans]|uniref:centrosomal protein CCDC61-like n=1 Tax=Ischnura elegans TaxID=197161 RepID=UPI001ED8B088|nr:centrosomal protein CCDC61-like [Ischnura elegans]
MQENSPKMSEQPWLVTTCVFKGNQYLIKMNTNGGSSLELSVVDKHTGEEWSSQYDSKFIENLTLKTGNYKRFDIFLRMLKSGLLRTSECVSLDLLTFEALELLRGKKQDKNGYKMNSPPTSRGSKIIASSNRRYLILTYTVEFDRIHYPLPMEYIGLPNPQILQGTIRRLEAEIQKLRGKLTDNKDNSHTEQWKDRVKHLEAENQMLQEEIGLLRQLLKKTGLDVPTDLSCASVTNIPRALQTLEEQVKKERASFRATVKGLQEQNLRLRRELDELRHRKDESQKAEPVNIIWKRRSRSPATYPTNASPRENENLPSKPNAIFRHDVWRTRLNNPKSEMVKLGPLTKDMRCRLDSVSKHSDSDVGSQCKGPNVATPRPGNRSHVHTKGHASQRELSSCGRTSSSSDCSSIRGRTKERRPKCKSSRSSSRGSSCSACSSVLSSSISRRTFEKKARGDAEFMNPPRISKPMAQRHQTLSHQAPHKKDTRKLSRRGASGRISDLETRIKALQSMLKEGLSLT